ncbi:hypothetical protein [Qipengyuania gelatinilytica]|uniref:Uncharacterized protein n=1 Tax=Qipengyuania gelatinilytica TaxID=2867231 RepID=A0ABX9A615_9SPHN|nr:hypothetical protein [Qipengyuania gelatinilytica]QZD95353.1 hypothetical protein K3136_01090 [Qipengyuania gelatinilytica]
MMRVAALIFGSMALAAPMATPASAQSQERTERGDEQQIGTRFKRKAETPSVTETRLMQKSVARCVVYRNKDLSRDLLANSDTMGIDFYKVEDLDADGMFDELDVADCLGRAAKFRTLSIRMTIPLRTLRNLMAEEVYLMDQEDPLALTADAPEYLENRYYATGRHPGAVSTAKLSDCIVRHGTASADALLRSRPGSDDENEAIDALSPALVKCAGEGIADAEISTSMVRTVVADGLWARMHYGPTAPVAAVDEETKDDDA